MTHLCVHARGNTSARIHGESIDIRAESELLECTSSNRVNPAYDQSSPNLATHPSSFVFHFFFFCSLFSSSSFSSFFFFLLSVPSNRCPRYWIATITYTRVFNRIEFLPRIFRLDPCIIGWLDKLCGYSFFLIYIYILASLNINE